MAEVRKLRNLPRLVQDLVEMQDSPDDKDFQAALELAIEAIQERDTQLQGVMNKVLEVCEKRKAKISSL